MVKDAKAGSEVQEKLCPMLQKACVRDECKLWIKVTLSGMDKQGKPVSHTPPEQCAFFWAGLHGLKEMQVPPPAQRQ